MSVTNDSLTVLIVDEDTAVLTFLSGTLRADHLRPLVARSAAEAMEIVKRAYVPVDLVLSDEILPESSGSELMAQIRTVRPGARAMYMSAASDEDVIRISLRDQERIDKPPGNLLLDAIRDACKKPLVRSNGGTE